MKWRNGGKISSSGEMKHEMKHQVSGCLCVSLSLFSLESLFKCVPEANELLESKLQEKLESFDIYWW